MQKRALRLWLAFQRRRGECVSEDTEAKLLELCAAEGWNPDGSDGEDEDEEMDNSEPLDDSDVILSDSGILYSATLPPYQECNLCFILCFPTWFLDDDLEGYDKMVTGRRKTGRVSHLLVFPWNLVL